MIPLPSYTLFAIILRKGPVEGIDPFRTFQTVKQGKAPLLDFVHTFPYKNQNDPSCRHSPWSTPPRGIPLLRHLIADFKAGENQKQRECVRPLLTGRCKGTALFRPRNISYRSEPPQ